MKKLIITEKPSVAEEFKKTLENSAKREDGYFEGMNYIITWCVGHLITLSMPEKYGEEYEKWSFETLPFIPNKYRYEIIDTAKKQFNIVKKCLNRSDIDTIYYAGDSAREGEYIQRLVRQAAGRNTNAEELRVWIDSQTEEEILKGIREAKPLSEYDKMSDSGYMRAIEDYLIGINFSRALTLKYGQKFNNYIRMNHYTPISVGRVMTCVLGMIVQRERDIRSAVKTPFYGIKAILNDSKIECKWKSSETSKYYKSPLLFSEDAFSKEEDAIDFSAELSEKQYLTVSSVEETTEYKSAPLLFNLAELQSECSKKFKITPDETLNIIQSLYDKKLMTYPRTDARVLSSAIAKEIETNICGLKNISEFSDFANNILSNGNYKNIINTKYVDDKKITDHYAIIPTGETSGLGALSDLERNIYDLITKRFLAIFMEKAEFKKATATLTLEGEEFHTTSKYLLKAGYLELDFESDNEDEKELCEKILSLNKGSKLSSSFEVIKGSTSLPKRYTSGSIILAMENAGNLIEDEELRAQIKGSGIGTSATRAETIKKLIKNGYIRLDKKTQVLTPAASGEVIYEIVKASIPSLLSPKMTASWEKGLTSIVNGEVSKEIYSEKLNNYVIKEISKIKEENVLVNLHDDIMNLRNIYSDIETGESEKNNIKTEFTCPKCGNSILRLKWGYACSKSNNKECDFTIGYDFARGKISEKNMQKLFTTGYTDKIKFKKKADDSTFEAKLCLNKETGSITFFFDKK